MAGEKSDTHIIGTGFDLLVQAVLVLIPEWGVSNQQDVQDDPWGEDQENRQPPAGRRDEGGVMERRAGTQGLGGPGEEHAFGWTHRRPTGPQASRMGPSAALLGRGIQVSLQTLLPRHTDRQTDTQRLACE